MIADIRFNFLRGKEVNPQRRAAWRERAVLPFLVEPDTSRIWGVDTSHWDGNVDFGVTAAAGAKFAFIKCLDGTAPTPYFRDNFNRAGAAGLLASGYAWLYPDRVVSTSLQARRLAELAQGMTLPAVIDFEWTTYAGQQANPNYDDLRKWATEYNRLSGKRAILYSAAGYMNVLGVIPADLRALFEGFWFASYGGTFPTLPRGFTDWDCWQFTASGDAMRYAPGDKGKLELDLNYMKPEFYAKFGGTVPEPPPVGGTMIIGTALVNVNLRDAPAGNPTGTYLMAGDRIEADRHEFQWLHITKINGVAVSREYWASAGTQEQYINWEEVTSPPPNGKDVVKAVLYHKDGTETILYPQA